MNFQTKVIETAADLRARAVALADSALTSARARAGVAAHRVDVLRTSLTALQVAARDLNQVARHHVSRFVKANSVIARDAGKDVSAVARATYSKLANQSPKPVRKAGKTIKRKRAASGARTRAAVKAA